MMKFPSNLIELAIQSPQETYQVINDFSYRAWSRNVTFLNSVDEVMDSVVSLLRPRALSALPSRPEMITINLFQDKEPVHITDCWSCVLYGVAAKFVSDVVRAQPTRLPRLLNTYPWLADSLVMTLNNDSSLNSVQNSKNEYIARRSDSIVELYGTVVALEALYWNGTCRSAAVMNDVETIIKAVIKLINTANNERQRLNMRWRLALWRAAFDMMHTLSAMSDLDLYGDVSGLIPLRQDWKTICPNNNDCELIIALFEVFEFAANAIPKRSDFEAGTVFSGPGVFKGSGIAVRDMTAVIKSTAFMLHKLGVNDAESKRVIMKQCDFIEDLKNIAVYVDDVRQTIVDLLVFMGTSNAVSQISSNSLLDFVSSNNPVQCLKGLKLLAHSQCLIDCDKMDVLINELNVSNVLIGLMKREHYLVNGNDKVGQLKLQFEPTRDPINLPSTATWFGVCQAYAARILGELCFARIKKTMNGVSRDSKILLELAFNSFKFGNDLEKWGFSHFLAGLLWKYPASVSASVKPASGNIGKYRQYSVSAFQNKSSKSDVEKIDMNYIYSAFKLLSLPNASGSEDLQFRLECWGNGAKIITNAYESILRLQNEGYRDAYIKEIHQMGMVPALLDILKFVAHVHGEYEFHPQRSSSEANGPRLVAPGKQPQRDMIDPAYRYSDDHTLPSCVYNLLKSIHIICQHDTFTAETLAWDANLILLERYLCFVDPNVSLLVKKIFDLLINDLKRRPNSLETAHKSNARKVSLNALEGILRSKIARFLASHADIQEDGAALWPNHLKQYLKDDVDDAGRICFSGHVQADIQQFKTMKICSNPQCNNREVRKNQFRNSKREDEVQHEWFCCGRCQAAFARVKYGNFVNRRLQQRHQVPSHIHS